MHSDPVADMLTRIRNAVRARKQRVDVPRSNLKMKISEILKKEGYVDDYREVFPKGDVQGLIELKIRYDKAQDPVIVDLQRVSKPGVRKYMGWEDIPKVRNGLGVMILTTSKGLMTDREARRQKIGGEGLCAVW